MNNISQQWKAFAKKREIKSGDIAALCIYRALAENEGKEGAIRRLRKSFSPITNPVKIENGAAPYFALSTALWSVKYSILLTWLDEKDKNEIVSLSKEIKIKGKEIL